MSKMVDPKFAAYIKSLGKEDAGSQDYGILFGGKKDGNIVEEKQLEDICSAICERIDEEVLARYYVTADVGVIETVVPMEVEGKSEVEDDGEIARWCETLESTAVTDVEDFFKLPDSQFEKVLTVSKVSLQMLEGLVFYAHGNAALVSGCKVEALVHLGLLPKMFDGSPLRSIFPIYQKFVAINANVVVEKLLLPMYQRKAPVPRPLLNGIDKQGFLRLALTWMKEESIDLSSNFISTLTVLFEGQKKLEDSVYDILITLLDQSLRIRPEEKTLAFFLRSFLSTFGSTLSEDQLQIIQRINDFNQTDLKPSIQTVIDKNLSALR